MRIKALSAFPAGRSEHKEPMQTAFQIVTKKCAQGVQEVRAVWAFPAFYSFLHKV